MADLLSIAQVVYDAVFPNATSQTVTKVQHVIEKAKTTYAWQMWITSKQQERADGFWEVPSVLLKRAKLKVKDNEVSLLGINIFRSLEGDAWIQQIGGGECNYIRLSQTLSKILNTNEYLGNDLPVTVVGDDLIFREGVHKSHEKEIPIIYASNGDDLEDSFPVDDAIGEMVSDKLYAFFGGKRFPADTTENSNQNT